MPVHYADTNKPVNDLFTKDFPVATTKLEVKSYAPNGVSFTVLGNQTPKTGAINSEVKLQFNDVKNGLKVTESWTNSDVLGLKVELSNKVVDNLNVEVDSTLVPSTNTFSTKVLIGHKTHQHHSRVLADLLNGPVFNVDSIITKDGFVLGGETGYNVKTGTVTKYNATFGYINPEYALTLQSFIHRLSLTTEAGTRVHYNAQSEKPVSIEVGARHILDKHTAIKAKVDSAGQLGLSLTQVLRPGIKAIIGASIDTSHLSQDAHKFGFSFVVEN